MSTLLLVATSVACAPATTRSSRGPATTEMPAARPSAEPGQSSGDPQPGASGAQADFSAEWAWIQAQFPGASRYRPVSKADIPIQELLRWARPSGTATVYDRDCRPIRVTREQDELVGRIDQRVQIDGNTESRSFEEVVFGTRITVTCGGNVESYRRGPDGQRTANGSRGGGCAESVGHLLSKVTSEAAWYNAAVVRLSIGCTKRLAEKMTCAEGGKRKCTRCVKWGVHASSAEPGLGMGRHVPTAERELATPVDCSTPCASTDTPAEVRRARRALKGHELVGEGPERHPFLFRTKDACERFRRANGMRGGERTAW